MGYREKKKVSDICGYILQLPESVLSKKHVIRQQKMILSVEGYAWHDSKLPLLNFTQFH